MEFAGARDATRRLRAVYGRGRESDAKDGDGFERTTLGRFTKGEKFGAVTVELEVVIFEVVRGDRHRSLDGL